MSTEEVKKVQAPAASAVADEGDDHDGGVEAGESEEPQAYFEPVVKLNEVEVVSGEEGEDVVFTMRAKLFDFRETLLDKGTGKKTWCERGVGNVRFLKHKEAGKVRMLMRQEKTLKIIINHLVESRAELTANMGSDRAWVWTCYDFSEGVVEPKTFALRFANAENAQAFKEAHESAKKNNKALEAGADAADTSAGDEAAKALKNLDVKKD
ncbi:ran-specific GTPase-activating protein [Thraustotheca clavata]|uniref:Ran-specific GTPase-activating protein n=1 Tax=Thraustotheca clavata TaxID=74557 RepID=A0A1V9YWP5_9STRA|nr:ran-specific GTPase-activating protein [Thraustotheca clavata]